MLEIFGTAASRTSRVLWALEELGLDYVHHPINHKVGENRSEEYLALSPTGAIPVLRQGLHVIRQSMAINLYLASEFGHDTILPAEAPMRARCYEWTLWAATEMEPFSFFRLTETMKPEAERDAGALAQGDARIGKALDYLEDSLADQLYLLGGAFAIADLNVVGPLEYLQRTSFDFGGRVRTLAWLARCQNRPTYLKVAEMKVAA